MKNQCSRIHSVLYTSLLGAAWSVSLHPQDVLQVLLEDSHGQIAPSLLKTKQWQCLDGIFIDNYFKFPSYYATIRLTESCLVQLAEPSFRNGQARSEISITWHLYQFMGTGNYSPPVCLLSEPETYWSDLGHGLRLPKWEAMEWKPPSGKWKWEHLRGAWSKHLVSKQSCETGAHKNNRRKTPAGSSVATTHSGTRCGPGARIPGEAGRGWPVGTVRSDMWHSPRLSHSLAVVPSTPRFKSFQIIVKAMSRPLPGRGRKGGAPWAKLEPKERRVTTAVM